MNKEIDTRTLGIIGGFVMLALSFLLFFLAWNATGSTNQIDSSIGSQYQVINIESEKQQAEDLLSGKNNFSSMPVVGTSTGGAGNTNPFGQ